jgi:alpha-tubulin suppressor-like RCC1 family protein
VQCWGENVFSQLGIGVTGGGARFSPVEVGSLSNVVAITAAVHHTCALLGNGTARCWGLQGSVGVFGDGTTVAQRPLPVTVSGLTNATAIETGDNHTCALLANGNARCWGFNGSGQIGDITTTTRFTPTAVGNSLNPLNSAVAITAGGAHTCALLADGSAKCWGNNETGQLGISNTALANIAPTPVLGGGGSALTARNIAAGRNHTCAVRANATVACWGSNDSGQLGNLTVTISPTPVPVSGLTGPVSAIAAGDTHTCALVNGSVQCWGANGSGQLGLGDNLDRPTAVTVPGLTNAVGIAAGGTLGTAHTCASLANGTVRCWGSNGSGQLGTGNTSPSAFPVAVPGLTNVVAIAAGEFHTCALVASGASFCWGFNGSGRLGEGTQTTRLNPALVGLTNVVGVAGGSSHTCALRSDGAPFCWGANASAQLGIGSTGGFQALPMFVNLPNAIAIAGGLGHSCAVVSAAGAILSGDVRCWGDNSVGQLGNASTSAAPLPAPQVVKTVRTINYIGGSITIETPLGSTVGIAIGRRHSCTLHANGGVRCWGDNSSGQLGINSTEPFVSQPRAVPLSAP